MKISLRSLGFNLIFATFFALILGSQPLFAIPKLIEKVSTSNSNWFIPFEKYQLPNGLIVILSEDHSNPIVHVSMTYHVGSAREAVGKSGFAHFFEHMMFQGSKHVANKEHFRIITEAGGRLNGTTSRDRTNYFETVPANQLETMLWLEADRMGFLLDAVDKAKFETQRDTVKNERRQNFDNRPYGLSGEQTMRALYPPTHPYSWLTIGYINDLNNATVDDLRYFFLRWYGPNNAVLTLCGDFDKTQALTWIEKYFDPIPAGPLVEKPKPEPVILDQNRFVSHEDPMVRFPQLVLTFPTVPSYHKDEAPLDCLAMIIGQGVTSRLNQKMVKPQLALQANAFNSCSELAGEFTINAIGYPNQSLVETLSQIKAVLKSIETDGISNDDLERFKASVLKDTANQLKSVDDKGFLLANYQTLAGNPNGLPYDTAQYLAVSKDDVLRVYNTYIKGKPFVALSVYPKGYRSLIAGPDSYIIPSSNLTTKPSIPMPLRPVQDTFDRNIQPTAGPAPVIKEPKIWFADLPNTLKFAGIQDTRFPTTLLQITIQGGHRLVAPQKAGLAQLTADMLMQDSKSTTNEAITESLEKLGSSILIGSDEDSTVITVESLTDNLDKTLVLLQERLFNPGFKEADFNRIKNQKTEESAHLATKADYVANQTFRRVLYGPQHPWAYPVEGTAKSIQNISLADCRQYYALAYSPHLAQLSAVSNLSQEQLMAKLAFLGNWKSSGIALPQEPKSPSYAKPKIFFVDKKHAVQSEIRIGYLAMPYDATGPFYKATLMNYPLGGTFSCRINLQLREDKGLTYGAGSGFTGSVWKGPFAALGAFRMESTGEAIKDLFVVMNTYKKQGITETELAFMKRAISQSEALKLETDYQKAELLNRILTYHLSPLFLSKRRALLASLTKADVDALAKTNLPLSNMVVVVVGDRMLVRPQLEALKLPIVDIDFDKLF
ncbi:MAG: M16 family metallopeptidase [Candidatus Margulisiibacteriota bacterium]